MDEQAHELMRQMQDEEMRQHEEDKVNAFPLKYVSQGMELRDYFAARAMQSLVITHTESAIPDIASMAYMMADKMMEERDAHQDGTR
jgi:hypothetical protein